MSKMKRKWLRVIEFEETGRPIDEATRTSLLETHPDIPILQDEAAMPTGDDQEPEFQQQMQPPPPALMVQPDAVTPMRRVMGSTSMLQMDPRIGAQLEQELESEIGIREPRNV